MKILEKLVKKLCTPIPHYFCKTCNFQTNSFSEYVEHSKENPNHILYHRLPIGDLRKNPFNI